MPRTPTSRPAPDRRYRRPTAAAVANLAAARRRANHKPAATKSNQSPELISTDSAEAAKTESFSPPPCFYWNWCAQRAVVEKAGRSVCRRCADTLRGREYPLRDPSRDRRNLMRLWTLTHPHDAPQL